MWCGVCVVVTVMVNTIEREREKKLQQKDVWTMENIVMDRSKVNVVMLPMCTY